MKPMKLLTSQQAAAKLKVNYDHLMRLVRKGVVKPHTFAVGKSHIHGWTADDLKIAKAILSTRRAGRPRKELQ
jgi:hypothetical protein